MRISNLTAKILTTRPDSTLTFLRVTLSIILFAHGAQKLLGWFGGHGPLWTVEMWAKWFGFPSFITWLVIVGEFFGPLLLLVGAFTRVIASIITLIMLGAVYFVHFKWGFFMNWYSEQGRGEGYEIHLLILCLCITLVWRGGGKWSVDDMVSDQGVHL